MASAVKPKLKADDLKENVSEFIKDIVYVNNYNEFQYQGVMRDLRNLAKDDAFNSYLLQSRVFLSLDMRDEFNHAVKNIRSLNEFGWSSFLRLKWALCNLETDGVEELVQDIFENRSVNFSFVLEDLRALGQFETLEKIINVLKSDASQVLVNMKTSFDDYIESIDIANKLGISQSQISNNIRVAGEIFRNKYAISRCGRSVVSEIIFDEEFHDDGLLVTYNLDISYSLASEMTWDISKAIVERGCYTPYISISVAGSKA